MHVSFDDTNEVRVRDEDDRVKIKSGLAQLG